MSPPSSESKNNPIKTPAWSSACYLLHAGFLPGLLFNPDDGGDIFLLNVGWFLTAYTALLNTCNFIVFDTVGQGSFFIWWAQIYIHNIVISKQFYYFVTFYFNKNNGGKITSVSLLIREFSTDTNVFLHPDCLSLIRLRCTDVMWKCTHLQCYKGRLVLM
jgi:hypothetical protein